MKIDKRLEELQAKIKPEQKYCVWYMRGEYYENKDGERVRKEEIVDDENVINIIVSPAKNVKG